MLPPVRTIAGNQPKGRVLGGTLPALAPARVMAQDATAPDNLYRTNPSSPTAKSNDRGSFTGGAVRLLRKALPINAAMFAQDMTGNKVPLTEQDLSQDELNVMRAAARRAAVPNTQQATNEITPYNYLDKNSPQAEAGMGTYLGDPQNFEQLVHAIKDPTHRMATTIGGGTLQPGPKGTTILTDSYDFQSLGKGRSPQLLRPAAALKQITSAVLNPVVTRQVVKDPDGDIVTETNSRDNIYQSVLALEQNLGSTKDGKGIPSNINLGNLKRPLPGEFPAPRVLKGTLPPKK